MPFVKSLRIKEAKIRILNVEKNLNQTPVSAFTDDSLSSLASNSTSNSFLKKTKKFTPHPNSSSCTPSNGKHINHFQFVANNSAQVNRTITDSNFTIENELSSDNSFEDNVSKKKQSERIGSFRLKNSSGASLYYIKNSKSRQKDLRSSYNAAYDDFDDDQDENNKTVLEEKQNDQSTKVDMPRKNSFMRKSHV